MKITESEREYIEERAAIYQYDAGFSKAEAEKMAMNDLEHKRTEIETDD